MMEEKALQNLLIDILRSELTVTPINEDIKDKLTSEVIAALYKLSKAHDLAHIVSSTLGKLGLLGNDEISAKYQKQEMLSVYRCERINYEFKQICRVLDDANISYIPLKGSVIRPHYPYQSMRTSCDIDILVKESDLNIVSDALVSSLQYHAGDKCDHDISFNSPSGIHFELHFSLLEGDEKVDSILSRVWDYSQHDIGSKYIMNDVFLLFYHFAHMAKHFNNGGCGVRPFMDLWIMENKMGIDRHSANDLLERAGLDKFSDAAFALADVWFERKLHTSLTIDIQDYIMNAGVYGTFENQIIVTQSKKGNKFKHLISKIFLPYSEMKIYFPSLAKCPLLFPFYQVRRWFIIVARKNGVKGAISYIKMSNSISDESREHIRNLCRELGI